MHTIFTFYDYWNSTIERFRKRDMRDFHVGGLPPSRNAIIAYNKCFSAQSSISIAFATQPLASLITQKTILFSTNCPLFFFILQNPDNLQQLASLGLLPARSSLSPLDHQAFFLLSAVLRRFLVPLPPVEQEVAARLAGTQGDVAALHIRCGNPLADFKDQASFLSVKEMSVFNHCVKQHGRNVGAIVVASDSTRAKKMIANYNPGTKVLFADVKSKHTMTRYFSSMSSRSLLQAFVEMVLLSRATVLVGTTRSSFSLCAAAMKGELPFLVTRGVSSCSIPKKIIFGSSVFQTNTANRVTEFKTHTTPRWGTDP